MKIYPGFVSEFIFDFVQIHDILFFQMMLTGLRRGGGASIRPEDDYAVRSILPVSEDRINRKYPDICLQLPRRFAGPMGMPDEHVSAFFQGHGLALTAPSDLSIIRQLA
ncbi:MAG: hypothetical protein ACOZF0_23125 [Thermodesulfobacteriota bacterium]